MKRVKLITLAALLAAASGCVLVRDSIPIMGEGEDGTHVLAYATRTRSYMLTKAAEKIDLWKVSSDNGVEMTGSDASSDSTRMIDAIIKGIELGGAIAGQRLGVAVPQPQPQLQTLQAQPYPCRPGDPACEPADGGGTGN